MLADTYTRTVQPYAYGTEKHTIRVWYVPYAYGMYHTRMVSNTHMVHNILINIIDILFVVVRDIEPRSYNNNLQCTKQVVILLQDLTC